MLAVANINIPVLPLAPQCVQVWVTHLSCLGEAVYGNSHSLSYSDVGTHSKSHALTVHNKNKTAASLGQHKFTLSLIRANKAGTSRGKTAVFLRSEEQDEAINIKLYWLGANVR